MGLYVLFFGTKKKYNNVAHHTIWMTKRFKSLLNDIFKKKILTDDFSLYTVSYTHLTLPTKASV